MRRIQVVSIGMVVLFCITLFTLMSDTSQTTIEEVSIENSFQVSDHWIISGNDDWETQGWPGNGSESNPFRIENFADGISISIADSTQYFIIQNCSFVYGASCWNTSNGIIRNSFFHQSVSILISQNLELSYVTISGGNDCIYVYQSHNITIESCDLSGAREWGIMFQECSKSIFANSTIDDCGTIVQSTTTDTIEPLTSIGGGLRANCSLQLVIHNNTFEYNLGFSIAIYNSRDVSVTNNLAYSTFIDQSIGIVLFQNNFSTAILSESKDCAIVDNQLGRLGLQISGNLSCFLHDISGNTVLTLPLLYIKSESETIYEYGEYGQIIVVNCSRIKMFHQKVTATTLGIKVFFSSSTIISNAEFSSLQVRNSDGTVIQNCSVVGHESYTIHCFASNNTSICNNDINGRYFGIIVQSSHNVTIKNNNIVNVEKHGIEIKSSTLCFIEGNFVTGCATPYHDMPHNIHKYFAAIIISGNNCTIRSNTIVSNPGYGIWVTGNDNILYLNNIDGNELGNALSEGERNQWDNGKDTGNCWGDWSGFGAYNVPGIEGCVDRYPRGKPNMFTLADHVTLLAIGFTAFVIVIVIVRKWKFSNPSG